MAPRDFGLKSSWCIRFCLGAVVLVCCGLPLLWMAGQAIWNFHSIWTMGVSRFQWNLLGRTLTYGLTSAAIAGIMGIPAAMIIGRGKGWMATLLGMALPISLLLPSITYAYGWSQFFRLLGITFEPAGTSDVLRCVWTLATWLWAVPAGVVGLALRRMDAQVQQQAMLDGVLWPVTARLLAGPMLAGIAMAGVLAMQEFAVYEPTGISVVATEVRMVFDSGLISSPNNSIAAANSGTGISERMGQGARAGLAVGTGMPLLLVTCTIAGIVLWMKRQWGISENIEAGNWPSVLSTGWRWMAAAIAVLLVTVVVPGVSMWLSLGKKFEPIRTWQVMGPQMTGSLVIACAAGVLGGTLALLMAVRPVRWAVPAALISFLVGGQLLAIALIRIYNQPWLEWVYNAPPIVIMACMGRFAWLALLAGMVSWSKPWKELREMAAVDGAGWSQTARRVIWPLAWPLYAAAGMLVMILSLSEVPATVLLSPQRPPMLVPLLMTWVHMLRYDAMIEGSLLLMLVVIGLGVVAVTLGSIAAKRRAGER